MMGHVTFAITDHVTSQFAQLLGRAIAHIHAEAQPAGLLAARYILSLVDRGQRPCPPLPRPAPRLDHHGRRRAHNRARRADPAVHHCRKCGFSGESGNAHWHQRAT